MEIEKLTKTQIILLTLLVSFVTSIATGIVTVTLLDQAPPGITHTVSKVVETTVEKVVPAKSQGANTVKTVVVKEDDLIADAVDKNEKSAVRILTTPAEKDPSSAGSAESESPSLQSFVALGFILSSGGIVVTDSVAVSNGATYSVELYDGSQVKAQPVFQNEEKGVAFLDIQSEGKQLSGVTLADSDGLRIGQTALAIIGAGEENTGLLSGIISSFNHGSKIVMRTKENEEGEESQVEEQVSYRSAINTDLDLPQSASGSMLLNTKGHMIGMNVSRGGAFTAVPSNTIKEFVQAYEEGQSASSTPAQATTTGQQS